METSVIVQFRDLGMTAAIAFAAMGSAMGTGVAAMSAIGAWKKCYAQNKTAPFILVALVGLPLSQTIYGMILMGAIEAAAAKGIYCWSSGILAGMAIGASAMMQGKAGANAADAMGETGKGFTNYIMALGIIESVALFVMVFVMMKVNALAA